MKAQVEQIPSAARRSFVCRRFDMEHFDHPLHFHPEIEFTYIVRSSGTVMTGDHVGEFAAGDFFLLGENLPHIFRNTIPSTDGAVSEVLHLSRDTALEFIDHTPELVQFSALLEQAKLGLKFDAATADEVGALLRNIRVAEGIRQWTLFFELAERLLAAPAAAVLASPSFGGSFNVEGSDRMQQACQYIFEHFDEHLTHENLAARVNLSPAYFSRLFRKITRRTYSEFLTEVRLGHACRLLGDTDLSIVDIAFSSGFRNLSSFNRRFLRAYACTPRTYRARLRRK